MFGVGHYCRCANKQFEVRVAGAHIMLYVATRVYDVCTGEGGRSF